MAGIYFHIPFCKRLCGYCDFFKSVHTSKIDEVVACMLGEIAEQCDFIHDEQIHTIYFGGGTPSLLKAAHIESLMDMCHKYFDTSSLEEVTLEANPDDLSREYLESIYNIGINRLSIGVQSFDDDILKSMNRRHCSQQAIEAIARAREVGFDNITIDLIFGFANGSIESLDRSIDIALSLGVEHISAYHLTIESGTEFARRLARGELSEVSEEQSEREYALLHERLTEGGYEHYEISNYALKGRRSKHNSSYWSGVEYLGIGAGAHGYNGVVRRAAKPSIESYLKGGEGRYEIEQLSEQERYNEYVMTSLRWSRGVDVNGLTLSFGESYTHHFERAIAPWIESGELFIEDGNVKIDSKRYMLSDFIIESLLVV